MIDLSTETVFSATLHEGADDECPYVRAARKLPLRLAETVRGLIGAQA
jgi:hypothetical protein